MFGLKFSDIEFLIAAFRRYPDVEEAIVFGSRAMGNFKSGSDVDIALKGNLKKDTAQNLSVEFNQRSPLPYKFDIVDYAALSHQPLIEHIDRYGQVLYKKEH